MRAGFTLIELLVVVAIISILAVIAVPNFLDAQVRAKVAAAKNNMRTVATNLETYAIDYGHYPAGFTMFFAYPQISRGTLGWPAYPATYEHVMLGELHFEPANKYPILDPFLITRGNGDHLGITGGLVYLNHGFMVDLMMEPDSKWDNRDPDNWRTARELAGEWSLHSVGPAQIPYYIGNIRGPGFRVESTGIYGKDPNREKKLFRDYDPTNGTLSLGKIYRTQKRPAGFGCHEQFYTVPPPTDGGVRSGE